MKKKLIITFVLFVLAGVIFAVQMPRKSLIDCASRLERDKAADVVESMLTAVHQRNLQGFKNCWDKQLSIEQINAFCQPLSKPVAKEFYINEALIRSDIPNTLFLVGVFDSNPRNQEITLKKNGNTYYIAEIKQLD